MIPAPLRLFLPLAAVALAGCAGRAVPAAIPPAQASSPPPMSAPVTAAPTSTGFIAPRVMDARGLEDVVGRNGTQIANVFGPPRLEVHEGDALKLQFSGEACVLDVFLYPLRPAGEPVATHLEARRASDGREVERVACANALRRAPRR